MADPRVLVVGDVMRDVIVRPEGPLLRGTDRRAAILSAFGGAGANQAAWLARFGAAVRLVACVGAADRDAFAAQFRRHGIEPVLAAHPDLPTGTVVAVVDPDGERSFFTARGANDGLARRDLPADLLDGVAALHVSGYALVGPDTRETVLALLDEARRASLPVSFDPGSAAFVRELGATRVLDWLDGAALCLLNAAEAEALTGVTFRDGQFAALLARFGLVVLKLGPAGAAARARDGGEWLEHASAARAVDTTGAGDAFCAAFLAARLRREPVAEALRLAVAAGTAAVLAVGAWPG